MALLEQQQAIVGEHIGFSMAEPPVSFGRFGGEDEPVVEQMKRFDFRLIDGQGHEDQVQIARHQLADEVRRHRLAELEV